jgi:putative ABC transport system substrate-binding protein
MNFYKALLLLTAMLISTCFAQTSKVLIINSDNTIYRYQENASEFKKILQQNAYQWTELDLASHATESDEELKHLVQKDTSPLIYCIGTKAYSFVRGIAKGKKLLFSAAINWRRLDIGTETYGVANELSPSQEISLLRYFFPAVKKIGLLYNDKFSREYVEMVRQEALAMGVGIVDQAISKEDEVEGAVNGLLDKVDIFWVISDPIVLSSNESVQKIFAAAKTHQKPVYAYSDVFIEQGAVLAISADIATIGRQSANLVMMIDNHKLPAGTVQIPAGSTVTLNKCTIDALHLNFNQDALDSVNQLVNCKE